MRTYVDINILIAQDTLVDTDVTDEDVELWERLEEAGY